MDALVKWLSAELPGAAELVFANALFALVPVGVMVSLRRGGLAAAAHRGGCGLHVLRGLLGTGGGLLAFYAYSRLPLADAYAIIFATPLLITALSVPMLGEAVGWRRWSRGAGRLHRRPDHAAAGRRADRRRQRSPRSAPPASRRCAILLVRKLSATETTASIALYSNLTVPW